MHTWPPMAQTRWPRTTLRTRRMTRRLMTPPMPPLLMPPLLAQPDLSGNSFGNKGWFVTLGFRKYLRKFAYASQKVAVALDRNKLSVGAHWPLPGFSVYSKSGVEEISGFLRNLIKIRVPGPKSAHFLRPPARRRRRAGGSRGPHVVARWGCASKSTGRTRSRSDIGKQAMLARCQSQPTATRH